MEFVDDQVFERVPSPAPIRPSERIGIDHGGSLMDAVGLEPRGRIRQGFLTVQDIPVAVPRPHTLDREIEIALLARLHWNRLMSSIKHVHGDMLRARSPQSKPDRRRTNEVR